MNAENLSSNSLEQLQVANHVDNFSKKYVGLLAQSLVLSNHTRDYRFDSSYELLAARREMMKKYLLEDEVDETRVWGRTLLSEIVSSMLLRPAMMQSLRHLEGGSQLILVPTDLDNSDFRKRKYHKGFDLLLKAGVGKPLLGIDVTMSTGKPLKEKVAHPGIHLALGLPVIVLPLRRLQVGIYKRNFQDYLDSNVRQEIRARGTFTPFAGLEREEKTTLQVSLLTLMLKRLEVTRVGLSQSQEEYIQNYRHLEQVFRQIDYLEQCLGRYLGELSDRAVT